MKTRNNPRYKLTPSQREEVVALYVSGMNMQPIAQRFGVTQGNVRGILRRRNVTFRSLSEANIIGSSKRRINDGLTSGIRSYRRRAAQGKCPTCSIGEPARGKVRCHQCIKKTKKLSSHRAAKGLCPDCGRIPESKYTRCSTCLANKRDYYRRLKADVVAAYGGKCACCGITDPVFLCLDHVHNNGAAHRREGNYCGPKLYLLAKRQNYPSDYQVLCHNCNFAKQFGECPHKKIGV